MADDRYAWLDEEAAERLLRGRCPGTPRRGATEDDAERVPQAGRQAGRTEPEEESGARPEDRAARLAAVLDELVPDCVGDGELPGEADALAAFRAARTGARAEGRGASGLGVGRRALLHGGRSLRAGLAVVLAGFTLGGVAVAATTGALPTPFDIPGRERPLPRATLPGTPSPGERETGDREAGDHEPGDREAGDHEAGDREASGREASGREVSGREGGGSEGGDRDSPHRAPDVAALGGSATGDRTGARGGGAGARGDGGGSDGAGLGDGRGSLGDGRWNPGARGLTAGGRDDSGRPSAGERPSALPGVTPPRRDERQTVEQLCRALDRQTLGRGDRARLQRLAGAPPVSLTAYCATHSAPTLPPGQGDTPRSGGGDGRGSGDGLEGGDGTEGGDGGENGGGLPSVPRAGLPDAPTPTRTPGVPSAPAATPPSTPSDLRSNTPQRQE
ncbi:hypothetical protein JJV70_19960 [Streptomyces sp. JJ66]|uniref:hypothetical protein n=1 Tax=Streptomyces sp. JJ66 TaxID=2803843 RepID=UPI001C5660C7|nr:hypothetical protein [Streptomyces sp. JJ66]MBW1604336.1 hypothetical protein [Streptomyces sp. JJ66]